MRGGFVPTSRVTARFSPVAGGGLLALGAPTNLADFDDQLTRFSRWARFACPGNDPSAAYSFAFQTTTEYVVGEYFAGSSGSTNYLFVVTVAGTSGASEPTWDVSTVRTMSSNSGGSTTTSGTMTAACVLNVGTSPYTSGWTGNHRTYRTTLDNANSLWYYDTVATLWGMRDRYSRRGELTTSLEKLIEHYAAIALSNFLQRDPFGTTPAGYFHFSDGVTQDYLRQSRVYKYTPLVTLANLLSQVTTYALYGPDLGPQYYNGNYGYDEGISREIAYYALNCVNYARANGSHLSDITYGGVTANRMRWLIPYMMNHIRMWMDDETPETPGGWAPFMFGLTANTLRTWYDYEVSQARDPNRFCLTGQIGSLTNTSVISFPWTAIPECLEEFCYFLRNTAVSSAGTGSLAMWDSSRNAYRYRTNEGVDEDGAYDLNGLIWPTFAWVANYCRENGSGTAMTALQMMQHADEMFNSASLNSYIPMTDTTTGFTGKIANETLKMPLLSGLAARNTATGRND